MKTKLCHGKEGILQKMNDRGSGGMAMHKNHEMYFKTATIKATVTSSTLQSWEHS